MVIVHGTLAERLAGVLDGALALTDADSGDLRLPDADGILRIVAQRGLPESWVAYWNAAGSGAGSAGASRARDARVIVEDVESDPLFAGTPALEVHRRAGVRALQTTPMRARSGRWLGALSTHHRTAQRSDERTLDVLDLLAAYAATLVEFQQTEEQLVESDAQFRMAIRGGPIVLGSVDRDLRYRWIFNPDPAFRVEDVIGRRDDELADEAGCRRLAALKREVIASGRGAREDVTFDLPQGARTWDIVIEPLLAPDGTVDGARTAAFDVTARRTAERELEAHRRHLEQLVEERTAELSRANVAAACASKAKSAFLANMSHEIHTPLNAILGMGYLIRRAGLSPEQAKRMDTLMASGEHLLGVLNDVLDISTIEAGKFTLDVAPVNIQGLVSETAAVLQVRAGTKQLHLRTEVGLLPANLLGDAARLRQALFHYADNAVRFTDAGCIVLRAGPVDEDAGSALLRFEVQDTGSGIAPEDLHRLFAPFEQVDNSMTRRHGGTGLGLALTKRLSEFMGGQAGTESTPGEGSTFWFTARLTKAPGLPAARAAGSAG